jgi:hypothetical protein
MKRGFIVFIIFYFIFFNTIISAEITGDVITGEATSQNLEMSILIRLSSSILSPESKTYLSNDSILLNYTSSGIATWYNLDQIENITLVSSPIYFSTTEGEHTLYLYANNSQGDIITKSTTFYVNTTFLTIIYDEYKTEHKGSSTNFSSYTYEDLQNLESVILENDLYGKIQFNEAINLIDDSIPDDNVVDIDFGSNISFNRIEVNSEFLPNFNKSATIYLYNLVFTNPRILRNGAVCPSTICTQESYSGGILKFNVTQFTIYSAEETPTGETTTSSSSSSSGGGGAGTMTRVKKEFSLSEDSLCVSLEQGDVATKTFTIINTGTQKLIFTIENPTLKNFLKIEEVLFELNPGESKSIELDFIARTNALPDLYLGKLIIKAGEIEKEILIAIEIESAGALFDVNVEIPDRYTEVLPGEKILGEISIYNLGGKDRVDVELDYIIKDKNNITIVSLSDTIAVETSANFIKPILIPSDIPTGKYIFYVRVKYDSKIASASAFFDVVGYKVLLREKLYIFSIIALIILIILGIISYLKTNKLFFGFKKRRKR